MADNSLGICPVCNGTGHMPCPDNLRDYGVKHGWYDYRAEDDTIKCTNCGGQYMYSTPTGRVRLNKDGEPCTHLYVSRSMGHCLTEYFCVHCADRYQIDSGD